MIRLWRRDDGSAAVELALLGPIFAVILAGLIEVGGLVQTVSLVRNAAREGARYAAISDSDPAGKALSYLSSAIGSRTDVVLPAKTSISVSGAGVGNSVTVTVPVTLKVSAPVIQNILGATVPISASATMPIITTQ
jgi:Flp pilus assembly protein TadG